MADVQIFHSIDIAIVILNEICTLACTLSSDLMFTRFSFLIHKHFELLQECGKIYKFSVTDVTTAYDEYKYKYKAYGKNNRHLVETLINNCQILSDYLTMLK